MTYPPRTPERDAEIAAELAAIREEVSANTPPHRKLVTYQHCWTSKSRDGWEYEYHCTWDDGTETREMSLPWGDLDGAVELPMTSWRELREQNLEIAQ